MINRRIIGRLDVKSNFLIKGIRMEGWRKVGSPVEFAKKYYNSGIDELIFIDVVASLYERNNLSEIVSELAQEVFIPITAGGGIRNLSDVGILLKAGADKITLNTAAIRNPSIIQEISSTYGSQATVVAIEAKQNSDLKSWEPLTDNGRNHTNLDVIEWSKKAESLGAGELLLTSIDKDGTRTGCDVKLLQEVSSVVKIPVIGSGGIGSEKDALEIFKEANVDALAIGTSFHYEEFTIQDLKNFLNNQGISTRIL
jgi:cyclase